MTAAWWRRSPPDTPAARLAKHAALFDAVIASTITTHGLSGRNAEELASFIRRRVAENDFALLREQGNARLATFLAVAGQRLAMEHRDELWARWREEAAVAGNAEIAATLERLVYDETLPFEAALEAAGIVDDPPRRAELQALWARRPWGGVREVTDLKWQRLSRRAIDDKTGQPSKLPREPTDLELHLSAILQRLDWRDYLILYQRFAGTAPANTERRIAAIANWLRLPASDVSQRVDALLERLRDELTSVGIEAPDVGALLADPRPGYKGNDDR